MQPYSITHAVQAERIAASRPSERVELTTEVDLIDGSTYDIPNEIANRYPPDAYENGYLVQYENGAVAIWRAEDFEREFQRTVVGA